MKVCYFLHGGAWNDDERSWVRALNYIWAHDKVFRGGACRFSVRV